MQSLLLGKELQAHFYLMMDVSFARNAARTDFNTGMIVSASSGTVKSYAQIRLQALAE